MRRYFVTTSVMVFEVALPFLGVTVTVTLQDPILRPFRVVPDTLQYLVELDKTFSETLEVEGAESPENVAIDLTAIALDIFTLIRDVVDVFAAGVVTAGVVTAGVVTAGVVTAGVLTIVVGVVFCVVLGDGADVDVVFQPGVVCFTEVLDPSPLPFHEEITKSYV
jgi:hypothetical protein